MRKLLRRNLSAWLRCVLSLAIGASIAAPAQAEELVIPGSGNPEYVLGALAKAFNAAQNRHRVSVPPSIGTAGALREVEQGSATLGRVGRPLKEAELAKGLKYIALGRDPVVFVAGAAVTVRNLTRSEAIDIYTGKLTDWRGLNGKPGPIRAIGREGTDTSRQAIARAINAFVDISYAEQVKMVHLDPQMIELLDRYPTSLGFLNRSALAAASTRLVPLNFEGVEPTVDNLIGGRYPISLEFGLIHKSGSLNDAGRDFLAFVHSQAGERILREHGIWPSGAAN